MRIITIKIFFLCFFVWLIFSIIEQWPDNFVHIVFCDVGQGDAILIIDGDKQMLIDGGPGEKVLSCLDDNIPFWDRTIDFLVVSHMDADHIGGLPSVLTRYSVNVILKGTSSKKTAVFEAFETAVSRKTVNQQIILPYVGRELVLSDLVRSIVISPQVEYLVKDGSNIDKTETTLSDENDIFQAKTNENISENNLSIGLYVIINEVSVLLTGDLEEPGELAVVESGMTKPADIVKAGHHGSKSSSSRQFISIFRPEVSVISSGKNNQYNHPSTRVTDLFRELGVDVFRTDESGNIEFITDGIRYWQPI